MYDGCGSAGTERDADLPGGRNNGIVYLLNEGYRRRLEGTIECSLKIPADMAW